MTAARNLERRLPDPFTSPLHEEIRSLALRARELGELRDDVAELYAGALLALQVTVRAVRYLVDGPTDPRDVEAERALLAGLWVGTVTLEDVAPLERADLSPTNWALFCALTVAVELSPEPGLELVAGGAAPLLGCSAEAAARGLRRLVVDAHPVRDPTALVLRLQVLTRQRRALGETLGAARELRSLAGSHATALGRLRAAARALQA